MGSLLDEQRKGISKEHSASLHRIFKEKLVTKQDSLLEYVSDLDRDFPTAIESIQEKRLFFIEDKRRRSQRSV